MNMKQLLAACGAQFPAEIKTLGDLIKKELLRNEAGLNGPKKSTGSSAPKTIGDLIKLQLQQ